MLTKSLRELEEAGLVSRKVYETIPPKVEYALTESVQELLPTLNELYKWGEAHMEVNLHWYLPVQNMPGDVEKHSDAVDKLDGIDYSMDGSAIINRVGG